MNIELQVKGKEVIIADYIVFKKNDDLFIFGIRNIETKKMNELKKEIDDLSSKIFFKEKNMILELKNKYIYFDLSEFHLISDEHEEFLIFAFLDKEDIIIPGESKIFSTYANKN